MPHVSNSELSTEEVIETVKNLTDLLTAVFPSTKIYPALGNHDYHPKHLMPPEPNDIYTAVGDLWSRWLPQDAVKTFKKGTSATFPFSFLQIQNKHRQKARVVYTPGPNCSKPDNFIHLISHYPTQPKYSV